MANFQNFATRFFLPPLIFDDKISLYSRLDQNLNLVAIFS